MYYTLIIKGSNLKFSYHNNLLNLFTGTDRSAVDTKQVI